MDSRFPLFSVFCGLLFSQFYCLAISEPGLTGLLVVPRVVMGLNFARVTVQTQPLLMAVTIASDQETKLGRVKLMNARSGQAGVPVVPTVGLVSINELVDHVRSSTKIVTIQNVSSFTNGATVS